MAEPFWRDPYVLMVAPNGARRAKADHPALPMTQGEIVEAVAESHSAGAHAAHVHVRDENGQHVLDADQCLRLSDALRSRCGDDLIIQITSEAVGRYTPEDQRQLVRAVQPEAVSIAFRELFAATDDDGKNQEFVHWAAQNRVAIQWILYEPADVAALASKVDCGVIADARSVLFVLGRYTQGQKSVPADLIPYVTDLKAHSAFQNTRWSACAFGAAETACLAAALSLGGDARIGFENSLWHADGLAASSNAERVAALVDLAGGLGLRSATPSEARERLGIRQR
ncbi:MAG: 3-keto-5-aminohexanoate cleavage protein [Rhizobiales bacterium]|nr:3-keto-5-aminohexanoate cleavage protein [Hyphomicrobiales bacterium]MBO6700546.1 3-keto-5-aminohexanoate cleavage protein [Hyphomicrobiales bacterium]MBO6738082.1 3-keto-5-aminohexanoate cleavage protein [Hyphomicrobiales bacterium]MBO6913611.1 3-keto-5-aminohexanoate cleavage protein [Hyphomicrobiales bacterium]MBO6954492.1 3-keto-5-aminohexanoate cleavage protein [Hyphomicrobiales bacterium]